VIATLVIAFATVINMRTAEKQWGVMDRQLGVMAYDQRPWLGVTEPTPKQEPRPSIANPSLNDLVHRATYRVKNFGKSPAFAVHSMAFFTTPRRPVTSEDVNMACQQAKMLTQSGGGHVIFPGDTFPVDFSQGGSFEDIPDLPFVWLRICIAYHDAARQMHTTEIWLQSTSSDNAEWITLTPGRPFRYLLITGFVHIDTKAN
jgi:hypothetical protein